jgi:hypothetical protein
LIILLSRMIGVFIPPFLHKIMDSMRILRIQKTMQKLKKMRKKKDWREIITTRKMNYKMKM